MASKSNSFVKTNFLNAILSQGMMNTHEATSMIRQGRIKINGRVSFDPKRGVQLKSGMTYFIDKHKFIYYPYLYLLYNKPQHINCSLNSTDSPKFPICFLNRMNHNKHPLQPLLTLPSNISGLTIYTDDPFLISHMQRNKHSITMNHEFEVQFMHKINDMDIINNLHYTDWDYLNSQNISNSLHSGVDIHVTKNKQRFTNVNIMDMQLIDDNFKNDNINYENTRISKWIIKMSQFPKGIYRLLRSVHLSPYYIKRIKIGNINVDNEQQELLLHSNDWRIMNKIEIAELNYQDEKYTDIDTDSVMTSYEYSKINDLFYQKQDLDNAVYSDSNDFDLTEKLSEISVVK